MMRRVFVADYKGGTIFIDRTASIDFYKWEERGRGDRRTCSRDLDDLKKQVDKIKEADNVKETV